VKVPFHRAATLATVSLSLIALAACKADEQPVAAPDNVANAANTAVPTDKEPEKKSIIRPDVDVAPEPAPTPEPTMLVVPFPASGAQPDDAGKALIDGLIAGELFRAGGPITIWGHSDSRGSDAQNLAASRRRAEAVETYLEEKGVPASRITVIPLGEARPIAPNRKLDGTEDPEGQARNRRVEIRVDVPPPPVEDKAPDGKIEKR
jgi:OOP family OmpA-OmpF porin